MTSAPSLAATGRRIRDFLASLRLRLVWWFVLLLAVATIASVLVARQVLLSRLDAVIDTDLVQEIREAEILSAGNDPETGEPFGTDVARIFDVYLERNIPTRPETVVTFVDGRVHGSGSGEEGPALEDLPLEAWAAVRAPEVGRLVLEDGATLHYRAVPFRVAGETRGVFAVVIDRSIEGAGTDTASLAVAGVGLVMLLIGSLLAIRLADSVLRPVREVRQTAHAISETDLSRRISVEGHDEIAQLASTFNDMLERLDAAFDAQRRFIDDAGHELRTPITVIQGHLDTLGDDPEDRARTLELLHDELGRVRRLIDDLITLARSERPDFVRPAPTDLGDLTRRVAEKARGLGDRDWRLDAVADEPILADEQRLTQALLQLAENAVRHTAVGAEIGVGSTVEPGADEPGALAGVVRLWVRDTGPGIPADEQDRIFERFFRGRSSRRRSEGSGLGLSIVAAIAEAHGGSATLDSPPAGGSTFTIHIPLRRGDQA